MAEMGHEKDPNDLGFEREDLGSRPIFGFMITLVVVGVLIYYVLWGMFHLLDAYNRTHQNPTSPMVPPTVETRTIGPSQIQRFPEPRLEDNERTELNDFRYREEETLNSYGWLDDKKAVAHIPITRAMELVAQRGLPTTPRAGEEPTSPVNLARQAAAKSDRSALPENNK
jgi:hypothetical protein